MTWDFGNKLLNVMIRTFPLEPSYFPHETNCRGIKLEPEDLDVLYERSVLHAEHGSFKKVYSSGVEGWLMR